MRQHITAKSSVTARATRRFGTPAPGCVRLAGAAVLSLALGACAFASRENFTADEQAVAAVPGYGTVRV